MRKRIKNIFAVFMIVITLVSFALPLFAAVPANNPMDSSNIMEDFKVLEIDPNKYPKDPSADYVSVVHLTEYAYR